MDPLMSSTDYRSHSRSGGLCQILKKLLRRVDAKLEGYETYETYYSKAEPRYVEEEPQFERRIERESVRFSPGPHHLDVLRALENSITQPSWPKQRRNRHDSSQQSPLAPIPEGENGEPIEALNLTQNPPQATLLGLPPELRNLIYKYVFSDWKSRRALDFLRTCRQVHAEAANLAFSQTLFRIHTEHWPDEDFFLARYTSQLPEARLNSIRHLSLRLPRGAPYDCYNSKRLHANLPSLGFKLTHLSIFSHYPRPLPRVSEFGGVMEINLCQWLVDTLYNMPTLTDLRILNYESASPGLFDIPSPRLVRLLRGQIFRDVISERQSLSEREFQWYCHCETDRTYSVFSAKLGRMVNITFESSETLDNYGLGDIYDIGTRLNPEELLKAPPPDMNHAAYAALLAQKGSSRKRLSRALSMTSKHRSRTSEVEEELQDVVGEASYVVTATAATPRRRLSKRYSYQSQHAPRRNQQEDGEREEERQRLWQHRQSWHPNPSPIAQNF